MRFTLANFVSAHTVKSFHANDMLACGCECCERAYVWMLRMPETDWLEQFGNQLIVVPGWLISASPFLSLVFCFNFFAKALCESGFFSKALHNFTILVAWDASQGG